MEKKRTTRQPNEGARKGTIHRDVARRIGSAVLSGELKPGDCVGGEIERSQALGISRAAYREAIRMLVAKGLLETRPKAGTHVAARGRWNLLDSEVIAWMFSGNPDPRFIRDLLELRALIEPAAAAMAARRRSDAELLEMERAMATMTTHGLHSIEGQDADRRFHNNLLLASGNEAFASLSESIEAAVKWITHYRQRTEPWRSDLIGEHQAVLNGIAAGDPERARDAMAELLKITLADITSQFYDDGYTSVASIEANSGKREVGADRLLGIGKNSEKEAIEKGLFDPESLGKTGELFSLRLQRAERLLTRATAKAWAGQSLRVGTISALSQIAKCPGISQNEVAKRTITYKSAINLIVNDLEKLGWAERRESADDRRRQLLYPTNVGASELSRIIAGIKSIENRMLAEVPSPDLEQLSDLLDRLYASFLSAEFE